MATPEQWLAKLPRLNVYKAKGVPAPHKPLLLLVLLELAEQDQLPNEMLPLTPELSFRFFTYWNIHQFADSRNNDSRNGLALCKNAHWLFDHGLWTLSDNYTVLVAAGRFAEHSPNQKSLGDFHGQRIHLPADHSIWPNPVHLAWHRKKKFQGA